MRLQYAALPFLLAASGATCAQESYSAKSLFFGEDNDVVAVSTTRPTAVAVAPAVAPAQKAAPAKVASKKPASQNIGASYFIRLKHPDGSTRDVLASRKFKSGERFQLGVKVNKPAFITVFNEDGNGKVTQIYPRPGNDNFVNAMGVAFLPSQGAFEFDHEPGVEHLLVYVSQKPAPSNIPEGIRKMQPDVVTATYTAPDAATMARCDVPASTSAVNTMPQPEGADERLLYASKAIKLADDAACAKAAPAALYASKAIVFSDDADTGGMQAASYVVKKTTTPDASLFLKIRLLHE
ncbi:DUF4384 domain-containing protein [Cupriavidus oxalaticus]|uniref:DUF4384 domain-containing protein n=1 Tax=Cupriavidus oxalaticus TaxID=96344 RepID=UPI003F741393